MRLAASVDNARPGSLEASNAERVSLRMETAASSSTSRVDGRGAVGVGPDDAVEWSHNSRRLLK